MSGVVTFAPYVPWLVIGILGAAMLVFALFGQWRGLGGAKFRLLAGSVVLAALANPALRLEERDPLPDIVIAVVDRSSSQELGDRPLQRESAVSGIRDAVAERANTDLRVVEVLDGEGDAGTRLMAALQQALAAEPAGRVAGVFLITDGQLHDLTAAPDFIPAPMHVILTGNADDFDRRLTVRDAPAFAILGEPFRMILRIDAFGNDAEALAETIVPLTISVDGGEPLHFDVSLNEDIEVPVSLPHAGMNVLQFNTPTVEGELTDRNNSAVVQINGVRDRLRVLLVSGVPHPGERTWRNLLKSDSSVDLVHFTILRPPGKQDGTPVTELSLIAFPTRELFVEKIDEFDLIILDRYKRRGLLPGSYFDNIRRYVEEGGALLVAAGPDFAGPESVFRSPLETILPGIPTARVFEREVLPKLTDVGTRHPVTGGLAGGDLVEPDWGRWLRQVEVAAREDTRVVLEGVDGAPLLMLGDAGEGRVALLASDQAWLWDRGYDGGGPQAELLRGLAHWLMKEPELEEEALWVEPSGQTMRIVRRTLAEEPRSVTITSPDGGEAIVSLSEQGPGRFEALWEAPEIGLYRLSDGAEEAVIALGPTAPKEFANTIADGGLIQPVVERTGGGIFKEENGLPDIRAVREGRVAAGNGWAGIVPREAYRVRDMELWPILPGWLVLLLSSGLILLAWLFEGRFRRRG
ncbi:MAG: hypothetical protein JJ872_07605 [Marivivens sp.]|nr:hypothetical protein [Marivivens sp.]